jgi:hypothetical protein
LEGRHTAYGDDRRRRNGAVAGARNLAKIGTLAKQFNAEGKDIAWPLQIVLAFRIVVYDPFWDNRSITNLAN